MADRIECRVISAADVDAPHLRERIWIAAHLVHAHGLRELQPQRGKQEQRRWAGDGGEALADTDSQPGRQGRQDHAAEGARGRDADRGGFVTDVAHAMRQRQQRIISGSTDAQVGQESRDGPNRPRSHGLRRWPVEPGVGRVVDGLAHRAHRIRALGNGQVSRVAATAWQILTETQP